MHLLRENPKMLAINRKLNDTKMDPSLLLSDKEAIKTQPSEPKTVKEILHKMGLV